MEAINLLLNRKSTKSYTDEMPSVVDLNTILKAGRQAPSGMNRQPTAFLVVTDKKVRDEIAKLNAGVMGSTNDPFYGAPALIAVLADPTVPTYLYDGSLAMGQLLLAAQALGYGSAWIHRAKEVFETEAGKEILKKAGLPSDYEGIGFCIIGTPAVEAPVKEQKSLVGKL